MPDGEINAAAPYQDPGSYAPYAMQPYWFVCPVVSSQ